jgi:hypothetical protein
VRERVGPDLPRDFNLTTRDQWPPHGSSEKVFATIDRPGSESRPDEIDYELMPEIFDVAFVRSGRDRFGAYTLQLVALTDVGGYANHSRVVALLQPRDDDRSIEPTGVGEGNCSYHDFLNKYSELLNI